MILKTQLQAIFEVEFVQAADILTLRQFRHNNAYCLDEKGEIVGLCAVENEFTNVVLPNSWTQLQYLNLSSNGMLETLTFGGSFPYLEHLDLSDCQLNKIHLPEGFDHLRWLDLSRNQLRHFIPEGIFPALEHLDLSDNQLPNFSTRLLDRCEHLERLYLKGNPLDGTIRGAVDEEANCIAAMARFLRDLKKGATTNKEHKVLIVGNGGVGKSSLVERMVYDTFRDRYISTQGVALEQYGKQDDPFILNLWDFGGQDIYHATHRLFMQTDAIYLLLWDEETTQNPINPDGYPNYSLEYWLHYIQQQGKDSPIIIIKTKEPTNDALHPSQHKLQKIRKNLSFIRIDSEIDTWGKNGFRNLLGRIQDIFEDQPDPELGQNRFDLRQHLRDLQSKGEKALTTESFCQIASEQFAIEDPMEVLRTWLVPTGVVFYRPGYFNGNILLDQSWALRAIYSIFDRSKEQQFKRLREIQKGHFTGADLQRIWATRIYTETEQKLLVDFMLSCEICFETTHRDKDRHRNVSFADRQFIAPQLLPDVVPTSAKVFMKQTPPEDCLHVRYEHEFLHYGVIQSFLVQAQQLASDRDNIWQQGILLESADEFSLVRVEEPVGADAGQKHIHLISSQHDQELFTLVRNTLESLQEGKVKEWVSRNGRDYVELEALKNSSEKQLVTDSGKIIFVDDFQIFLQKLSQQTLREQDSVNEVEILLAHGKISRALEVFKGQAPPLLANEVILLQSRLSLLEEQERKVTVSYSDAVVERNQIRYALLSLFAQAKSGEE